MHFVSVRRKSVASHELINVEVAYALADDQMIIPLQVEEGCTLYQAVVQSGIVDYYPEIDPETQPMGIFGKAVKKPKEQALRDGERVELYRPLIIDPKQARANRAAKAKADKEAQ
ncbi:RnfH family protein [Pokkaliibacter sp. CJK22405]|uniref:RnfH family protein n=1 Tax=Pokkaliibacter sp. CJK22405 TaxID=3384615 RepID=UPI003984DEC8